MSTEVQEFLQARLDAVRTVHQELAAEQIKARSSEGAKFQPQLRALVMRAGESLPLDDLRRL
eukprot:3090078-Amphidinium_carterae.1